MKLARVSGTTAILLVLGVLLGSTPVLAEAEDYTIDGVHSVMLFRIKHLGVSYFHGRFNEMSGSFTFDESDPAKCKFDVTVKADSVDTNSARRERHLKSPDFLNAKQFPFITFKSKEVKSVGKDRYEVTGDLTLHGETKTVTVEMERVGSGTSPRFGYRTGFEAVFTIKRSDFGMDFMLQALSDEIRITVSFEGSRN